MSSADPFKPGDMAVCVLVVDPTDSLGPEAGTAGPMPELGKVYRVKSTKWVIDPRTVNGRPQMCMMGQLEGLELNWTDYGYQLVHDYNSPNGTKHLSGVYGPGAYLQDDGKEVWYFKRVVEAEDQIRERVGLTEMLKGLGVKVKV